MSQQKTKKGKDSRQQRESTKLSQEQEGVEGQIALVLQGGGGMGAYEVGAVKAIIEHAVENDKRADRNFFNIIAGSSIGAINGAILVQEFVKDKSSSSWSNAIHELENFWLNQLATDTSVVDNTPGFCEWWESMYNSLGNNDVIAKCEAARRYYSSVQFWLYGIPGIFSSSTKYDNRFLDPSFNYLQRGDWSPLGDKLENYKRDKGFQFFPIKTNPTKNEPRLLTTTIDVKTGSAVTFDSYSEDSSYALKTGDTANKNTDYYNNNQEITIKYPDGLMREHIMASAAIPANRDFTVVKDINSIQHMYWDGAFASNTPLRGLIQSHRDWYLNHYAKEGGAAEEEGEGITVPDLKEIYIIDLWPRNLEEKDRLPIPPDNNFLWSRMWDL